MIAAAQRQLNRLIAAAAGVTIFACPSSPASASARSTTARLELVEVQANDCGQRFFPVGESPERRHAREVDGRRSTSLEKPRRSVPSGAT
jgi:hypothetical protein